LYISILEGLRKNTAHYEHIKDNVLIYATYSKTPFLYLCLVVGQEEFYC